MYRQRQNWTSLALSLALATLVAGCGSTRGTSLQYGIYVADGGDDLVRIDGSPEWERQTWDQRASLDPDVKLVVYDPLVSDSHNLSELRQVILLERVAHVRQTVDATTGARSDATGNLWVASHVDRFAIPVGFRPAGNRPGMIVVKPRQPLPPGLYSIKVGDGSAATLARFGVEWPAVNKDAYAARNCVDQFSVGTQNAYFDCAEQPTQTASGLSIGDLSTDKRTVAGVPTLVVAGRIVNVTDVPRRLPPLRAKLLNDTGVEQAWNFQINRAYILPGEKIEFSSTVQYPMENSQNVVVSFLPQTNS